MIEGKYMMSDSEGELRYAAQVLEDAYQRFTSLVKNSGCIVSVGYPTRRETPQDHRSYLDYHRRQEMDMYLDPRGLDIRISKSVKIK